MSATESPLTDEMLDGMLAESFSDWPVYAELLESHVDTPSLRSILDVGGGAGLISDHLIELLPGAHVTIVDDSELVLARNKHHARKNLIHGSALDLTDAVADQHFDLVIINDLLHHLVAPTLRESRDNTVRCLRAARELLSEDGRILIYEITMEGWWPGVDPGDLIYALTRTRVPPLTAIFRRLGANTAGVGVAFRSRSGWRKVFDDAGLEVEGEREGYVSQASLLRALALGIRRIGAHVYLLRAR